MYPKNGVVIVPNVLAEGDRATILYEGILHNSGADSVYMHVGYGEDWKNTTDVQMRRTSEGFEGEIQVKSNDKLCMAFKDSAGNWDNNGGRNYTFEVQDRHIRNK